MRIAVIGTENGGGAVDGLLAEHAAAVDGRLVLDATNRVGAPVVNAAAQIAAAAPYVRYVRAFSSLGWENFRPRHVAQPRTVRHAVTAPHPRGRHQILQAKNIFGQRSILVTARVWILGGLCGVSRISQRSRPRVPGTHHST